VSGRPLSAPPATPKIVPKGLRSFDEHDADFFLELLPGPRNRDGLPESIRFWKTQIETTDAERAFRVGLIYGPSGCGKSSLVKAGLLPRLSGSIVCAFVEATADETEQRLLGRLKKACPALPDRAGLVESLAAVRKGRVLGAGQKLLIVIDQFEQWLHARRGDEDSELVAALRQCDGEHLQAIVLVRDDFWLAVSRFLSDLEVELTQGKNTALVDLFDSRHAAKVLTAFGVAFGNLPENGREPTRDQRAFLDQAIAELAQDGKVVSVRLALFAEMVKGKPWTPATLREVGGAAGVGVTFLEETFISPQANPRHRMHQKAAQAVLKALLPDSGTDIKGQMRSEEALRTAAGISGRPREFHDVLQILDSELRLITPTDPEGSSAEQPATPTGGRFYQLTHDYLVPSLRDWLARKQRETRRGRAELRLVERASLWSAKPENRHLPSIGEWARIRLLTRKPDWTDPQRRMMRRAGRLHGLRALGLLAVAAILLAVGLFISDRVVEANNKTAAHGLVQQLLKADTGQLPENMRALESYRRWADPELKKAALGAPADSREALHASLALLPHDRAQAEYVYNRLLSSSPSELPVVWGILHQHDGDASGRLWGLLENPATEAGKRFRAACALANVDRAQADQRWEAIAPFVADQLLAAALKNPGDYPVLTETLRPLSARIVPPLSLTFRDPARADSERSLATSILADYAADDPARLAELLMTAEPKQYATVFQFFEKVAAGVLPVLETEIAKHATPEWSDAPLDPAWPGPDPAWKGHFEAAHGILGEHFAFCRSMAMNDFLSLAEGLRKSGYRPVRFRPYADGGALRVAAVWARDGRSWRLAPDMSRDEVEKRDEANRSEKFLPADVASYLAADKEGKPSYRFAGIWVESNRPGEVARVHAGMTAAELEAAQNRFKALDMAPVSIQAARAADGTTLYCGIWGKSDGSESPAPLVGQSAGNLAAALATNAWSTLSDLSVTAAATPSANAGGAGGQYAAVWNKDDRFDSVAVFGLDPSAHLARCRSLLAGGFRPVSISVVSTNSEGPPATASVWHRPVMTEEAKDQLAMRQARAAVGLVRLGKAESVWPLLRHSADPRLRSFIVNWLNPLGADPHGVSAQLEGLDAQAAGRSPAAAVKTDEALLHPGASVRRALILALGTYGTDRLSPGDRQPLIAKLLELFENDPDPGIHGAAEWTLRKWGQQAGLTAAEARLVDLRDKGRGARRWYVNSQRQTLVLIEGPAEFRMGSPHSDSDRIARNEIPHRRVIPRGFAIAAEEVTVEQYQSFAKEFPGHDLAIDRYSPDRNGPMNGTSWFDAAAYCNWLSRKEGLLECYEPNDQKNYAERMTIRADALRRNGYRLPTESEWEYACRAGAETPRFYGASVDLLAAYAWYQKSSTDRAWPGGSLFPNDLGLFDTLGNVLEWCMEGPLLYQPDRNGNQTTDINTSEFVSKDRLLRGGSFGSQPSVVRSAIRFWVLPANRDGDGGFRPARTYP
jgi:formylglycine-generating enzyme required for sulfatase activity